VYHSEYRWPYGSRPYGSPCASGANEKKRLAEIHAAGCLLYTYKEARIDVADLLVEPRAIEIAQLREDRERLFAADFADRNAPAVRAGCRSEREREKRILVVLLEDDDRPGELAVFAIDFVSDVHANARLPDVALMEIDPLLLVGGVDHFLQLVPAVEVLLHRRARCPPSRRTRKSLTTWQDEAALKQLKQLAATLGVSQQALIAEGLNHVLAKYSKPTVAT
jgi:hypothetical protein